MPSAIVGRLEIDNDAANGLICRESLVFLRRLFHHRFECRQMDIFEPAPLSANQHQGLARLLGQDDAEPLHELPQMGGIGHVLQFAILFRELRPLYVPLPIIDILQTHLFVGRHVLKQVVVIKNRVF